MDHGEATSETLGAGRPSAHEARPGSARPHLALLVALVVMLVGQPLLAHRGPTSRVLSDATFGAMCLYLFFIVFKETWERSVALALFLPVIASYFALNVLPPRLETAFAITLHAAAIVFLGFAVAVILRDLFRSRVIRGDDVIGAVCGYILAALVWGNLYALTFLLTPGAFSVNPAIVAQLDDRYLRSTLFDYLSFTTMTSLGFADITPAGPPMYSLTWLEVIFGQFYMAVVVAQIVGLKLAEAIRRGDPGPK